MNVAKMIVTILEDAGVDYILGIPGSSHEVLNNALQGSRIKIIITSHEQGAAFIAGEIAREKGLTAVFCNAGPACGNGMAGTEQLLKECLPVIVFGAMPALATIGKRAVHESDSGTLSADWVQAFGHVAKSSRLICSEYAAEYYVKDSINTALSGIPGPVFLGCPVDVMKKEIPRPPSKIRLPDLERGFDPTGIEETAALLQRKRPALIWAGYDVTVSKAQKELLQLAETYDIPVASTPHSKGVFPEDHPLSLGVLGLAGQGPAKKYLFDGVSVLLAVGCRFGETSTYAWDRRIGAKDCVIRVDGKPPPVSVDYPGDIQLTGNPGNIMAELSRLKGDTGANGIPSAAGTVRCIKESMPVVYIPPVGKGLYHPGLLMRDIQKCLPGDAVVNFISDIGSVMCWALHYLEIGRNHRFTLSIDAGGMGYAAAGAIGTQIANPGEITIALVGDGAFMMNGMEVLTAVQYGIPVIWVVLNNYGYGMVREARKLFPDPVPEVMRSDKPRSLNCAKIAEGMGAKGFRLEREERVTPALMKELLGLKRPVVLEVIIDAGAVAPGLKERIDMIMEAQKVSPPKGTKE
ncbi:MAG: thiamine pyrophosphate-binding protein [bacterium]|nr:thiamine pyrophosphate-binding protein [bacterium]